MTDKRFTYGYGGITYKMEDGSYNVSANLEEICTWLNELHEENKQYREWLGALREELSLSDRDNTILEKENQQLKKELNDSKTYNGIIYANATANDRKLLKQIQDLKEENEDLKQLNIPKLEIEDTVLDYKARVIRIFYKK